MYSFYITKDNSYLSSNIQIVVFGILFFGFGGGGGVEVGVVEGGGALNNVAISYKSKLYLIKLHTRSLIPYIYNHFLRKNTLNNLK